MTAGKTQITGGDFQGPSGSPLSYGYLTMQLSHDEQENVDPGEVVSGFAITVPLDVNGNIAGTVYVWPNDQLDPANSYYIVNAYRRDGTLAWGAPQYLTVPSSPNPYNVGNWIPVNPLGSGTGAPVGSILLQTNGVNNSDQALLNLAAGTNITLANSSGTTTITASGGASFGTAGFGGFWSAGLPITAAFGCATSASTIGTTINQVTCWQFTLTASYTISGISTYVVTGHSSQHVNFGIYNSSGSKLIDSGAMLAASNTTAISTTITPVTLPAGVYYYACSTDYTSLTVEGFNLDLGLAKALVLGSGSYAGYATGTTSGGVLPATLGSIDYMDYITNATNMPGAFFSV